MLQAHLSPRQQPSTRASDNFGIARTSKLLLAGRAVARGVRGFRIFHETCAQLRVLGAKDAIRAERVFNRAGPATIAPGRWGSPWPRRGQQAMTAADMTQNGMQGDTISIC